MMTAFGSQTLSYDANGNLLGDGSNTYIWDSRNHLASVSGGVRTNFSYDAMGRRTARTISGTTTQYLYDGLNPVQELDGATTASGPANADPYQFTGRENDGTGLYFFRAILQPDVPEVHRSRFDRL